MFYGTSATLVQKESEREVTRKTVKAGDTRKSAPFICLPLHRDASTRLLTGNSSKWYKTCKNNSRSLPGSPPPPVAPLTPLLTSTMLTSLFQYEARRYRPVKKVIGKLGHGKRKN